MTLFPVRGDRKRQLAGAMSGGEQQMLAIGRSPMTNPEVLLLDEPSRVGHAEELDRIIGGWIAEHTLVEVVKRFEECEGALGPVYDAAQIFADPHFRARGSLVTVPDPVLGALTVVNVVPRLSATPGTIAWLGPALGQHNEDVYCGRLGLAPADVAALRERGVI